MLRRLARTGASIVLALALALAGPARGDERGEPVEAELDPGIARDELPAETPPGPIAVFAAVEKAWSEEDVDAMVALLDPEDRVRIAMATAGPRGGWFNRDQAYFLIKDMFAFTDTRRFEFERYWNLDSRGRSPYAVAVRELGADGSATRTDRVYISLKKRGDVWTLAEIRSIDP